MWLNHLYLTLPKYLHGSVREWPDVVMCGVGIYPNVKQCESTVGTSLETPYYPWAVPRKAGVNTNVFSTTALRQVKYGHNSWPDFDISRITPRTQLMESEHNQRSNKINSLQVTFCVRIKVRIDGGSLSGWRGDSWVAAVGRPTDMTSQYQWRGANAVVAATEVASAVNVNVLRCVARRGRLGNVYKAPHRFCVRH